MWPPGTKSCDYKPPGKFLGRFRTYTFYFLFFIFYLIYISAANSEIAAKSYVDNIDAAITDIVNALGQTNGIATLGPDGKVPASQLPDSASGEPIPQMNSDWNATTGVAQILNKPQIGKTPGTIAAGDDSRFTGVPTTAPVGNAPTGWVHIWFE